MTQTTTTAGTPVRLLFEMTRDDNPRLYDDLIRFNKGTKRVNRLRFLAHEGLLAQNGVPAPAASPGRVSLQATAAAAAGADPAVAHHTNQAFDAPAGSEED